MATLTTDINIKTTTNDTKNEQIQAVECTTDWNLRFQNLRVFTMHLTHNFKIFSQFNFIHISVCFVLQLTFIRISTKYFLQLTFISIITVYLLKEVVNGKYSLSCTRIHCFSWHFVLFVIFFLKSQHIGQLSIFP